MQGEDLEFLISQYLDGALTDAQRQEVEARIAQDPAAAKLLEEYRKLDTAMKAHLALPQIAWGELSNKISSDVSAQDPIAQARGRSRMRIGPIAALAACALIAVGLLVVALQRNTAQQSPQVAIQQPTAPVPNVAYPAVFADVAGPQVESAQGPAVAEVALGPAPQVASDNNPDNYSYAQAVVVVRPRVSIAAATAIDNTSTNPR